IGQCALVGFRSEDSLVLIQVITTGMDNTLAIEHGDVFDGRTQADQQLHAGNSGRTSTQTDDLGIFQLLVGQLQRIDHRRRGHDGGTVLVIMENRDIALLDQRTLDFEALGRLDVFQVDSTEGAGDTLDGINERLRAFGFDFDIENVNTSKTLEQHPFAFHDRLGSQRAEIAQTENSRTIGNNRNQVALTSVLVGVIQVLGDFAHGLSNTRTISQRQITRSGSRLGQLDAQFARTRASVIFERISSQIRHDYVSGE